jgi:ketopantoate reductase
VLRLVEQDPAGIAEPAMHERAHVIGLGEVGRRLAHALDRAGWRVHAVTRASGWEAALDPGDPAPRIVAVREEQLAAALERFPPTLRGRLVLVQNGFLDALHPGLGPVTRGLVYFTSKGEFFRVLCPSPFHGPHAAALAAALAAGGIDAEAVADSAQFREALIVKGVWNTIVGLPLAVREVDLGAYLREWRGEFDALVEEGTRAAGAHYEVEVDAGAAGRKILETTTELGWVRGGKKALAWRNGAVAWFGRQHGVPTPINDALLRAAGYDPDLPPREQD